MQTQNNQRPAYNSLCACGDPDCIYSYQADRFDRHTKRLEGGEVPEMRAGKRILAAMDAGMHAVLIGTAIAFGCVLVVSFIVQVGLMR